MGHGVRQNTPGDPSHPTSESDSDLEAPNDPPGTRIARVVRSNTRSACIWNPIHLDKIRQNRTYRYLRYVQVRTITWQYMNFTSVHGSTYWYVPVRTFERTCGLLTNPGSVLRVQNNHGQLLCKGYNTMMSNFQKCQVQRNTVHSGTYWYVLVRTSTETHFI
jgi:hypothetical protein